MLLGRVVDFGVRDLLAGQQVLELIPRRRRLRRRRLRRRRRLPFLALGLRGVFNRLLGFVWQES